jgi:spore maturation protein CgeB
MRTFEIAALGGCMVVEDTSEHREIFGEEGLCVLYFSTPEEAAKKIGYLLSNAMERRRLSEAVRFRVTSEANTYTDRLREILSVASRDARTTERVDRAC